MDGGKRGYNPTLEQIAADCEEFKRQHLQELRDSQRVSYPKEPGCREYEDLRIRDQTWFKLR